MNGKDLNGNRPLNVNTMMTDSGGGFIPAPCSAYYTPEYVQYCQNNGYSLKEAKNAFYDPVNNNSANVCKDHFFSFYNGVPVFNVKSNLIDKIGLTSWSFGIIVLNNEKDSTRYDRNNFEHTLRHEYGHTVQMKQLGIISYTRRVAVPSVAYNIMSRNNAVLNSLYYCMPWERAADYYGGVSSRKITCPLYTDSYWIGFCLNYSGG